MNVSWALHVWVVAAWPTDPHIFSTPTGIKVVTLITSRSFIRGTATGHHFAVFLSVSDLCAAHREGSHPERRGEGEKPDYSVTTANKLLSKRMNREGRRKTRTPRRRVELGERKRDWERQSQWTSISQPWVGELQTTEPRRIVPFLINR